MLHQSTHFVSVRKLTGFGLPLVVALYAYSGTATATEEVEALPVPVETQTCLADGMGCGKPPRDREQMRLCQDDPENCELPPEVAERMALCQENPEAEECTRPLPPPPCDPSVAECELPPEVAERMVLCQENPDTEECALHAQREENRALCQENPDAEGCGRPEHAGKGEPQFKMHSSNKCRINPDFCNNPGPGVLNLEDGVLELPAVRVGNGLHYGARLRMSEDGMNFTLEEITSLEDEGVQE